MTMQYDLAKEKTEGPLILDLGCGPRKYPRSMGIDIFDYKGVDVVCDVFEYLSHTESKTFDKVVMRQFIEHVDPISLIREVNRVLKPNGKILVETPNALHFFRTIRALRRMESIPSVDHILVYTAPELKNLIQRNGFENIRITHFNDFDKKPLKRFLSSILTRIFPILSAQLRCEATKTKVFCPLLMPVRSE